MSMTGAQLIEAARQVVGDDIIDQQTWGDDKWLIALNDGLSYLYANYPETRLDSTGTLYTFARVTQSALGDSLTLSDMYFSALVEYLAFRYFDADAGDTRESQQATTHWAAFRRLMDPMKMPGSGTR